MQCLLLWFGGAIAGCEGARGLVFAARPASRLDGRTAGQPSGVDMPPNRLPRWTHGEWRRRHWVSHVSRNVSHGAAKLSGLERARCLSPSSFRSHATLQSSVPPCRDADLSRRASRQIHIQAHPHTHQASCVFRAADAGRGVKEVLYVVLCLTSELACSRRQRTALHSAAPIQLSFGKRDGPPHPCNEPRASRFPMLSGENINTRRDRR